MELFIPGIILVALMVYVSTRIKKNAAAAYGEEIIETDRFIIKKPEGFLSPVDPPEGTLFAAHSKDFGHDEAGDLNRSGAELTFLKSADIDERIAAIENSVEDASTDAAGVINENKRFIVTGKVFVNGIQVNVKHLLIHDHAGVYDLKMTVLDEYETDFASKIEEMTASFRLK